MALTYEEQYARQIERNKVRYKRLKEAGLCIACAKPLDGKSNIYCDSCHDKCNLRRQERRKILIANHLCINCGEKMPTDHKQQQCDKCIAYDKFRRIRRFADAH